MLRFMGVALAILTTVLTGCGGSPGTSATLAANTTSVSGTITFDKVLHNTTTNGLNYTGTIQSPARDVTVQAISNSNGSVLAAATTDANGNYTLPVPTNTDMQIRVLAEMVQQGSPSWTFRVVDNTASNAQWSIQGSTFNSGTTNITAKNLNAASGWTGSAYTTARAAAPFAILDDVYIASQLILTAAPITVFPTLTLNWSPSNIATSGTLSLGQITTTHYSSSNIYILGDANVDTDEYDDHVIIHEFGHYIEDMFSRADSLGGSHSSGQLLDMRVAFSEGWGNAFSGMATNDAIYRDSNGPQQSTGFVINVENNTNTNPGWFSEGSVQSILYDLYDSTNDGADTISLGFTPIYSVLVNQQRTTPAFTSLFSFITALKSDYSADPITSSKIDTLVSAQTVNTITDIYGSTETNSGGLTSSYVLPIYTTITIGANVPNLCTTDAADNSGSKTGNKLGEWRYLYLHVVTAGSHTISISGDAQSDPDFYISHNGSLVASATNPGTSDSTTYNFSPGDYVINVVDYNLIAGTSTQPARSGPSCLNISVSN